MSVHANLAQLRTIVEQTPPDTRYTKLDDVGGPVKVEYRATVRNEQHVPILTLVVSASGAVLKRESHPARLSDAWSNA
jgi:hypothetical protein